MSAASGRKSIAEEKKVRILFNIASISKNNIITVYCEQQKPFVFFRYNVLPIAPIFNV